MEIVKCALNDIPELQKICRQTFYETFAGTTTENDMKKFLDEAYELEKLKSEILNKNSAIFLALDEEKIIGYLKLNWGEAQTEKVFENALEIQRIYILKSAKRKGIGSKFMNLAEETARKMNLQVIWLGVWENNEAAKAFYAKKGFSRFSEHTFTVGTDPQTDWLLSKNLK